jgi:hypothetical protein
VAAPLKRPWGVQTKLTLSTRRLRAGADQRFSTMESDDALSFPQLTATLNASQICLIRPSLRRPIRSTNTEIETLSTESRLTTQRRVMGSSPGSSTTSLAKLRIVVVQGAMRVRRKRGIAASRDITTTGLLAMSGSSHHQISPRSGCGVTKPKRQFETRRDYPTHQDRRLGIGRTRHTQRRSRRND